MYLLNRGRTKYPLLSEAGSGGWRLFHGWDDVVNWAQYIRFTVDGREASANYENLGLDEEGYLTWNSTPGVSHSDYTGLNYDDMMERHQKSDRE